MRCDLCGSDDLDVDLLVPKLAAHNRHTPYRDWVDVEFYPDTVRRFCFACVDVARAHARRVPDFIPAAGEYLEERTLRLYVAGTYREAKL